MSYEIQVLPRRRRRNGGAMQPVGAVPQEYLPRSPLISELSGAIVRGLPREMNTLFHDISPSEVHPKGEVLFVEGQQPLGIFLLRSGEVRLSTSSASGKMLVAGRAGAGAVLNLPSVMSGRPNEFTAEVVQPVRFVFITRETLVRFLEQRADAAFHVAKLLGGMYHDVFSHVRYLGLSTPAPEKLARLLLEVSGGSGSQHLSRQHLTHRKIAEMIGASRETVTRLIAQFKKQRLIEVNGSGVQILNRSGLERLLIA